MEKSGKKTLLSGIKPTGRPHIANYFAAMKQFVDLQSDHDCFFMIADYHALNFIQDAKVMRENILGLMLDYLAIGLDPKKCVIFKQSDVAEHTELAWIFDTFTTMPYLERAHVYKDAQAKGKELSVGTFNYPMLMAADILLYSPDVVPVGQDQKQHVEYARDTAEKFNRIYGDVFTLPETKILPEVAVIPGTDGKKMSKSYNNTIELFATDAEIEKAVMGIVTDSEGVADETSTRTLINDAHAINLKKGEMSVVSLHSVRPANVYHIHKLFRPEPESELDSLYQSKAGKYKDLKEALIVDIKKFIGPLREKRKAIEEDKESILKMLKEGGQHARAKASAKMEIVREKVGVKLY